MSERYDAVIVGTGQAGPSLAIRFAKSGKKTAILERKLLGGTCVNVGCIPSKTLIASARAAHVARRGAEFGVTIDGPIRVDMARVKARKDSVVKQSTDSLEKSLRNTPNLTLHEGHGRLESAHTVRVGDRLLESEQIFLNVGARAHTPDWTGLADVPFLTNSSMMELDTLPEHLVIVGGSYIGLEFAQMYRRFGSRVTVVEMGPRLVAREDEEISASILSILQGEGIEFRLGAKCVSAARRGEQVAVGLDCDDPTKEVVGSHLLVAVGRTPNTHDLGLELAGIATDERGYITVDDELRTSAPGVWALGEVNGRGAFTHTAYNDYEIVAANLLDGERRRVTDRIVAYALYTDPPLGRVGLTEREVRASGRPALMATREMSRVARAVERGETRGLMKVLVDAETKQLLGAAILGIEGDEAIHSILDVMYADAPYTVIRRAVHIHPTVSELIPTLLGDLRPL